MERQCQNKRSAWSSKVEVEIFGEPGWVATSSLDMALLPA